MLRLYHMLRKACVQGRWMHVDVEVASPLCAGLIVADVWGTSSAPANVFLAESMDVKGFWALMEAALDAAEAQSPISVPQR